MRQIRLMAALASACAIGVSATAAERSRGRLMRGPDHFDGPTYMFGPGGQSGVFEAPGDVPTGWADHPSKVGGVAGGGQETATTSANGSISEEGAAKTTDARTINHTDPAISATSGHGGTAPTTGKAPRKRAAPKTPKAPAAPKAAGAKKAGRPAKTATPKQPLDL